MSNSDHELTDRRAAEAILSRITSLVPRKCPQCGVSWSAGEAEEMFADGVCSCLCGLRCDLVECIRRVDPASRSKDLMVRGFLEVEHQVRRWEMEERCQAVSSMEYVAHIVTETRKDIAAALAALERHDA